MLYELYILQRRLLLAQQFSYVGAGFEPSLFGFVILLFYLGAF
jgi:hypothetical protein